MRLTIKAIYTRSTLSILHASPGLLLSPRQAILPLRTMMLSPEHRDYLLDFMDHNSYRSIPGLDQEVVDRVREEWGQQHLGAEDLRRMDGILAVNCVEHRVKGSPSSRSFLPITSLASHSCSR